MNEIGFQLFLESGVIRNWGFWRCRPTQPPSLCCERRMWRTLVRLRGRCSGLSMAGRSCELGRNGPRPASMPMCAARGLRKGGSALSTAAATAAQSRDARKLSSRAARLSASPTAVAAAAPSRAARTLWWRAARLSVSPTAVARDAPSAVRQHAKSHLATTSSGGLSAPRARSRTVCSPLPLALTHPHPHTHTHTLDRRSRAVTARCISRVQPVLRRPGDGYGLGRDLPRALQLSHAAGLRIRKAAPPVGPLGLPHDTRRFHQAE